MTELDERIRAQLRDLGEVVGRHDHKLGEAMKLTAKDHELRALVAAAVGTPGLYWRLDGLMVAHIALESGDEATARRYLKRGQRAA